MNREQLLFLVGGFAFGLLFGYAAFTVASQQPELDQGPAAAAAVAGPRGPSAPTQVAGDPMASAGGGAPMMAEINALKTRLQDDPDDLESLVRLAQLYQQAGIWAQAAGYYERAVAVRPDDPVLLTELGTCVRGTGDFERALALFDRAFELDPSHWQPMFNTVIVAAYDLGRLDLASEALGKLEAIEPAPPGLDPARLAQLRDALDRARAAVPAADG